MMDSGMNNVGMYGACWWMMGVTVFFWIAVIGIGIWLIIRLTDRGKESSLKTESPRAILDRRFAGGDLSAEAYAEACRLLGS